MQKKFETKSANNFFCYDKLRREFLRLAGEHPEDNLYIEKQFEKCLKDLPAGTVINTKRNGSFEKTRNNTFRTIGLSQLYTVLPEILFQVFQCEVSGIKVPYLLDINCLPIICSDRKERKMIRNRKKTEYAYRYNKVESAKENYFYGIIPIRVIDHGNWSDAEVKYGRYTVNYNELETKLWGEYQFELESEGKEYFAIPDDEDEDFAAYLHHYKDDVKDLIVELAR